MNRKTKELIPPGLTFIANNIISKQNILGASREEKAKWASDLDLPQQAETIFFAGCGYQYGNELETLMSLVRKMDKSAIGAELPMRFANWQKKLGIDSSKVIRKASAVHAEIQPLRDTVSVLRKLKVNFGYLADDEPCCGAPLYYTGLQKEFTRNARQMYQKLKSLGVKRIISIVPSCTYTIRNLFPSRVEGYDLEVKHFTEVVLESMSSRKLRFPREVKVTYHDPCQLARYMGLIAAPRKILQAIDGIELIESKASGEWATCCGGGGGFEAVFPELSQILAVNRVKELMETGAQIIVTNCPGCVMQLKAGLKELKADGAEVLDLAQVVAMAME